MKKIVWDLDKDDPMTINIWTSQQDYDLDLPPVSKIFLGEAIESAGREAVMRHIEEIDRSPWIRSWHADHTYKLLKQV